MKKNISKDEIIEGNQIADKKQEKKIKKLKKNDISNNEKIKNNVQDTVLEKEIDDIKEKKLNEEELKENIEDVENTDNIEESDVNTNNLSTEEETIDTKNTKMETDSDINKLEPKRIKIPLIAVIFILVLIIAGLIAGISIYLKS